MARIYKTLFNMNLTSFFASLFLVLIPIENSFRNILALLLILTLTGNILASVYRDRYTKLSVFYLILSSVGLFAVMTLNTLASLDPENGLSISTGAIMLLVMHFVIGAAVYREPYLHTTDSKGPLKTQPYTKARIATLSVLFIILLFGAFMAYVMVTQRDIGLIEVPISQYSIYYSLIFLSLAGLFLKLSSVKTYPLLTYTVSALGIGLYLVFALPFIAIPSMLNEAETSYTEAFGDEWQSYGDLGAHFKNLPFNLSDYFFGVMSKEYQLTQDVLFYEGTEGVDEGLELRFDAYTPPADREDLPGEGSVLIRIHGGGWDTGDKGLMNFPQTHKYFAAQGYAVFDVQYGLNDQDQFLDFLSVPDGRSGSFDIDDMVRHLGLFTTYLADNHTDYGANIDSVFVSGGSAGGQLATALALASASGEYPDLIDPRITVNGLIPFYPANNLSQYRNIGGTTELVDPKQLVDEDSPPALLFQGDRDGFVDPRVPQILKETYLEQNNDEIAIIWMPYGAHASDLYFPGFYNQTFIYYMERFMYQYK